MVFSNCQHHQVKPGKMAAVEMLMMNHDYRVEHPFASAFSATF